MQKIARKSYAKTSVTDDHDDFMNSDSIPDEEKLRELKRRIDKRAEAPVPSGWGGKGAIRGGLVGAVAGALAGIPLAKLKGAGYGALGGGALGGLLGYGAGKGAQNARAADIEEAKQIRDANDYQTLLMYSKLRKERLDRERAEEALESERQFKRDQLSRGIMGGLTGAAMLGSAIRNSGMPRAGERPDAR